MPKKQQKADTEKSNENIKTIKEKLGLVHIITGSGKGKTTSSIGGAIRAAGRGLKVRIIQFFKRDTGEKKPLEKLGIEYFQFKPLHPYFKNYSEQSLQDLKKELNKFWIQAIKNLEKIDVLVIDEMGPALNWKTFEQKALLDFLENKPEKLEIIMTGRDFPKSIAKKADYISVINLEKHPYNKGIMARKGIEF